MQWYKLTQAQINDFEKQYSFNGIVWSVQNRWDADGNILNVQTMQKEPIADLTLENYDPLKYPLLGRKMGKLNKSSGYTTKGLDYRESTDGFFYAIKREDITLPALLDDEGNTIRPSITIPFSTFYNGCVYESIVSTEPDWITEE